jgi:hypothetical protein
MCDHRVMMRWIVAALLGLFSSTCPAWGPQGHDIVAEIAARRLDPVARAEVERLLGDRASNAMREWAEWADSLERWPGFGVSQPLHYVNFPRGGGCRYDARRDCRGGRCVVNALHHFVEQLRTGSRAERVDALKWVIHLMADIHQPLHAAYRDDRGGNDIQLRYDGRGTNLHQLLDSGVLRDRGLRAVPYAEALLREQTPPARTTPPWSARLAEQWAEESCGLVAEVYPRDNRLDHAYLARLRPLLDARLFLAGVRLADVLNQALGRGARALPAR